MLHRITLLLCLLIPCAFTFATDFTPDPASIQREGPAYRYPQAGWIVVHVEGQPYERGVQQGKLLSREIQEYIKCFAAQQASKSPTDGWKLTRTIADALFTRHFDPELLEEMKGIADGASAAGAKFDSRPLDLTDIVAINAWPELITLDDALRAVPNGLEGREFGKPSPTLKPISRTSRCSAFAATGSATKDGKAIIGHITMFDIYPCNFFNIWLDVKPAKGHRVVIQAAPGSVQSGMDWYLNDAGMVLTETTIAQTRYNPTGQSIGSRSRMAMQYGDSIDSVVKLLGDHGNGLYTNEWLLADMNTNEIAMFELGTNVSKLFRSSKNEWYGNTPGFYWGNNNTKDLAVRLETIAAANDRPADMTFTPEPRDIEWQRLYRLYKGSIDADFGKLAFGKPPLASRNSCDAKYTTADMALQLKSFAHWGDPYGKLWEPSPEVRQQFSAVQPIVPNDWAVLTTNAPPMPSPKSQLAVDLKPDGGDSDDSAEDDKKPLPPAAWHGTILPASDADLWLATSFASFQTYVARERQLLKQHDAPNAKNLDALTATERDELAVLMFNLGVASMNDGAACQSIPLRKLTSDPSTDKGSRAASGRGVMLLSELRRRLGPDVFDRAMDGFGREHAGQTTGSDSFIAAITAAAPSADRASLNDFFARWLDSTDFLPTLKLGGIQCTLKDGMQLVKGTVKSENGCTPGNVDITLESDSTETTRTFALNSSGIAQFKFESTSKPTRITVNKYGQTPCTYTARWTTSSYKRNLTHTLIVYGTRIEAEANHIAAVKIQEGIIGLWEHATVPVKPDTDLSDSDLHGNHLILVGRPETSDLIAHLTGAMPIKFGPESFTARGQVYANAETSILAAGANPLDAMFSITLAAGLSPAATLKAAESLPEASPSSLRILPAHAKPANLIPPSSNLTATLPVE